MVSKISPGFLNKGENATFATPLSIYTKMGAGTLAQMVEQRTENPCVPGSIPGGTTNNFGFKNLDLRF